MPPSIVMNRINPLFCLGIRSNRNPSENKYQRDFLFNKLEKFKFRWQETGGYPPTFQIG